MANALKLYGEPHKGRVVEVIDRGFDVLNSRIIFHKSNKYKCGLGSYEEEQIEALNMLMNLLESLEWRCSFSIGEEEYSSTKKPSQKGINKNELKTFKHYYICQV